MKRIGIIVTDPASYPPQDTDNDTAPLCAALRERGADARALVWHDASVDWASFDLLVIRSPWDYVDHAAEFAAVLDRIEATGVPLRNDAAVIRWNMDKHYLAELADRGIGVVPTHYCDSSGEVDAALAALAETGAGRAVVKPTVSAGSSRTGLFGVTDPAARELADGILATGGTVMVQPEIPELSEGREKALYLVDGQLTHTIAKGALLAPGGGFIGGVYQEHPVPVDASESEEAFAVSVLTAVAEATGRVPLYGRIDLVESAEFGMVLLEAELFEPDFHLDVVPEVVGPFAEAILDCAGYVAGRSTV